MADLSELDRSEAVKIAGANPSSGIADNFMQVDANGTAQVGIYDASGTAITSTSINSKDRIDVNLPSEGQAGSAVPFDTQQVGGTDGTDLRAIATDTSGNQKIVGNIASGSSDSGNPVKIGGIYNSSHITITNGERGDMQLDPAARHIMSGEISSDTRWGRTFHTATDHISTGAVAETALFYFSNPNASGKSARISKIIFSAPSRAAGNFNTYRVYINPTNSANGTALTIVGSRQTNQASTVCSAFKLPTNTSKGTLFLSIDIALGAPPFVFNEFNQWVEDNNSFLITTTLSNAADTASVCLEWVEE